MARTKTADVLERVVELHGERMVQLVENILFDSHVFRLLLLNNMLLVQNLDRKLAPRGNLNSLLYLKKELDKGQNLATTSKRRSSVQLKRTLRPECRQT